MKHIRKYSEVNESIGRGSVLFIKGKPEKGRRKLFATHILGSSEVRPGITMFFLPSDFYRIKVEDGQVKTVKVGFSDDSSLRSSLNIKSPDRISVVKNNAKTPWHWKTLKHTSIESAVKELEDEIKMGEYLLENTDSVNSFNLLYNFIVKKLLSIVFLGEKDPAFSLIELDVSNDLKNKINLADESKRVEVDWDVDLSVLYTGKEYRDLLEELDLGPILDLGLSFTTSAQLEVNYSPGDYYTPSDWDVTIESVDTSINNIYLDGGDAAYDSELVQILLKVDKIVADMDDDDIRHQFKTALKKPSYLQQD